MHCSTTDIPNLKFPRDEIIEIIPAAYQNEARRIHIPGIDPKIIPSSPQDIRIPVIPGFASGNLSPIPGLSTPAEPAVGIVDGASPLPSNGAAQGSSAVVMGEEITRRPEKIQRRETGVADKAHDDD
jgi:hypothetical protein